MKSQFQLAGIFMIIVLLFALISEAFSQTHFNFRIDRNDAVWQRVYDFNADSATIQKRLTESINRSTYYKDVTIARNQISCRMENAELDYKKAGGTYMGTTMIFSNGKWSGKVFIDVKDKKYRVTVTGLNYDAGSITSYGVESKIQGSWADVVLNRDRTKFKPGQYDNMEFLNKILTNQFSIPEQQIAKDDDW
jgi:hypothetical protein